MREVRRLVEAQVLARAGVRALAAGTLLSGPFLRSPGAAAAVLALAAAATAVVERVAVVRALDGGRSLRRAALEASVATFLLVSLALLQLVVVDHGRAGPDGQLEGMSALLSGLAARRGTELATVVTALAAIAVSAGAISGALTIERLGPSRGDPGAGLVWCLFASPLLGLLAAPTPLLSPTGPPPRWPLLMLWAAFLAASFGAIGLQLAMRLVHLLDRAADRLVGLAGARPSSVEEDPRARRLVDE